ncbi:MAG: CopG family transcriptional regulator [Cyanothece sp. SIO2G6]|nr:CopG family transcriptional regulator [Cyanothece sp. SIO2G6]
MQNTSIVLSTTVQQTLEKLAVDQNKTVEELLQEAIELYIFAIQKVQPKSVGMGRSQYSDLSERVDELLWQDP